MILGRKVDDLHTRRITIEVWLAEAYSLAVRSALVVFEHFGEALFELLGNSFAHYADTIDRVHQGLRLAGEQVSDERPNMDRMTPLAKE